MMTMTMMHHDFGMKKYYPAIVLLGTAIIGMLEQDDQRGGDHHRSAGPPILPKQMLFLRGTTITSTTLGKNNKNTHCDGLLLVAREAAVVA